VPLDNQTQLHIDRRVSAAEFEIVTVTFPTADTDVEIQTKLTPSDPEGIDFQVIKANGPPLVYMDTSPSRVKWSKGIIRLRSSVAGLKAMPFGNSLT
jgi:hypothetical protein